jgi:hypothetical protein
MGAAERLPVEYPESQWQDASGVANDNEPAIRVRVPPYGARAGAQAISNPDWELTPATLALVHALATSAVRRENRRAGIIQAGRGDDKQ